MGKKDYILSQIEIETISSDGKAIAKTNGQVIFVNGAVPGDVVDIKVIRKKKNYLEAIPLTYHSFSDRRREPFCTHFGQCGGCKWQHMDYESQLAFKQKQVADQLQRIGKLDIPEIQTIIPSEKTTLYRNKLEYTFSNRRWISNTEIESGEEINRNGLGFHMPGRFDRVIDVENCHLMDEPSNELRIFLKIFGINNNLTFFDVQNHTGLLRNLIIRVADSGEILTIVQFGEDNQEAIKLVMDAVGDTFTEITSLHYLINTKKNDAFYDLPVQHYSGESHIVEKMGDLNFRIGPKSFFQTNTKQALNLYSKTMELAELSRIEIVYDLYCGTGTIANYLAKNALKVIGLEYIEEAIDDAKINSELNNIQNTEFHVGDITEILSEEFFGSHGRPDVIVTDPPRSGMHKEVVATLLKSGASRIIYISCNPATQARDLEILSEDYSIQYVQPIDMFPHTHHLENIVLLKRKSAQ